MLRIKISRAIGSLLLGFLFRGGILVEEEEEEEEGEGREEKEKSMSSSLGGRSPLLPLHQPSR